MTDYNITSGGDDVHALSGAYAVDALEADESARFETHLRQCGDCRDEVDSLREAAAVLGTDDVMPPASVRDQVLANIGAIRPLPPLPVLPEPVHLDSRRKPRGTGLATRIPLLVAAAAVLIAVVGGLALRSNDAAEPGPRVTVAERVLAADDATRIPKQFPSGSDATVVFSRSEGRALILTHGMRPAPAAHDYQLWFQNPAGEFESAGLLTDLSDSTVVLEGDASRAVGVGITVEPDGGSERPTSDPIAFFTLDS